MVRLSILLYSVSLIALSSGYKHTTLCQRALTGSLFALTNDESEVQDFRAPQRMMIIEPSTQMKVVLIGTMHYNPTSIVSITLFIFPFLTNTSLLFMSVISCRSWRETPFASSARRILSTLCWSRAVRSDGSERRPPSRRAVSWQRSSRARCRPPL